MRLAFVKFVAACGFVKYISIGMAMKKIRSIRLIRCSNLSAFSVLKKVFRVENEGKMGWGSEKKRKKDGGVQKKAYLCIAERQRRMARCHPTRGPRQVSFSLI